MSASRVVGIGAATRFTGRVLLAIVTSLVLTAAACSGGAEVEEPTAGNDTTATAPPSVSPTPVSGRTDVFEAPFTYTLPPGWTVGESDRWFGLDPTFEPAGTAFYVLSSVVAARSDCSDRPKPGIGTSSGAMTSWLSTHPALDATTPRPVTLGAATGSWVDVQLADDWDRTCPSGLTLVTGHPDGEETWAIAGDVKERFYVLDLPAGETVTIVIQADNATAFADAIDEAAPVAESFEFPD